MRLLPQAAESGFKPNAEFADEPSMWPLYGIHNELINYQEIEKGKIIIEILTLVSTAFFGALSNFPYN